MFSLFVIVPIVLLVVAIRLVTRLLFGFGRGAGLGYGSRRGFGHRRHGFGGGLLTILSLVALDRLFLGRRW